MAELPSATVALESTVIAHGLPHPHNVETALAMEEAVRKSGANPATIGIVGGAAVVGLARSAIERFAVDSRVRKASLRDLPVLAARGGDGATTVAATAWLAHRAGIRIMATGGIGGVHRAAAGRSAWDVSADLAVLADTPITVVCSGAKSILDLPATRERLETDGVTVVGYGTDRFPAFVQKTSPLPVDVRCDAPEAVAAIIEARDRMATGRAILVCVPVPDAWAVDPERFEEALAEALRSATNLRSAAVTPFLLDAIRRSMGDDMLSANCALLENNARIAGLIARELAARDIPPRPAA